MSDVRCGMSDVETGQGSRPQSRPDIGWKADATEAASAGTARGTYDSVCRVLGESSDAQ